MEDEQGLLIVGTGSDAVPRRTSPCRILCATMATVGVAGVGLALASAAAIFSSHSEHQATATAENVGGPLSLYGYDYNQMMPNYPNNQIMPNYPNNYEDMTKVPCGGAAVCSCEWATEDQGLKCSKVDFPRTKCWSCCCYRLYPDLYHQAMTTMHAWLQMERGNPGGYYDREDDYYSRGQLDPRYRRHG